MKVLILTNSCSGLIHFRRQVLTEIAKDHETVVCAPKGEYSEDVKNLGCRMIDYDFERRGTNPLADYKQYLFYKKLIKKEKPDVVLTYTVKPNVYGGKAAKKTKTPYIANVTGLGTSIENGGLLSSLTLSLYKSGLKKASCVFFQNQKNKAFFESKGIVKGRARLIPGSGVDLNEHAFELYPPEDGGLRFLFVGRIMRNKGVNELLAAFEEIHAKHPETSLDIIGGCDENYTEILKAAEDKGGVRYHGRQKNVHPFYTNAHCTVLPSYHEAAPMVFGECRALGIPVISTETSSAREMLEKTRTGIVCENSEEGIYLALKAFLDGEFGEERFSGTGDVNEGSAAQLDAFLDMIRATESD